MNPAPPVRDDGTVNAYIEIPRGERRKYEFDMKVNARAIDRVMPVELGGYPVNDVQTAHAFFRECAKSAGVCKLR